MPPEAGQAFRGEVRRSVQGVAGWGPPQPLKEQACAHSERTGLCVRGVVLGASDPVQIEADLLGTGEGPGALGANLVGLWPLG